MRGLLLALALAAPWRLVSSGDRKAWRSVYGVSQIEAKIAP